MDLIIIKKKISVIILFVSQQVPAFKDAKTPHALWF